MRKQKVYIETSVVSYYSADMSRDIVVAGHQVTTREFWRALDNQRFIPVISPLVIKEASQGNPGKAKRRVSITGRLLGEE